MLLGVLSGIKALLSFTTIIPVGEASVEEAAEYFYLAPIAGLARGFIALASIVAFKFKLALSALYVLLHGLSQGFMHVDGFIDFSEALASRGDALRILKDSRRGSFAIAIYTSTLILTVSMLFYVFSNATITLVLTCIIVFEYTCMESMYILCLAAGREPPYDSIAKPFIRSSKKLYKVIVNAVLYSILLAATAYAGSWRLALASIASVATSVLLSIALGYRRLGFIQGDVVGFCCEASWILAVAYTLALAGGV